MELRLDELKRGVAGIMNWRKGMRGMTAAQRSNERRILCSFWLNVNGLEDKHNSATIVHRGTWWNRQTQHFMGSVSRSGATRLQARRRIGPKKAAQPCRVEQVGRSHPPWAGPSLWN